MSRGNNPFGMETARNEREREGGGTKGRKAREKVKTRERKREILPSQNYNTKCHNYLPNHTLF